MSGVQARTLYVPDINELCEVVKKGLEQNFQNV